MKCLPLLGTQRVDMAHGVVCICWIGGPLHYSFLTLFNLPMLGSVLKCTVYFRGIDRLLLDQEYIRGADAFNYLYELATLAMHMHVA